MEQAVDAGPRYTSFAVEEAEPGFDQPLVYHDAVNGLGIRKAIVRPIDYFNGDNIVSDEESKKVSAAHFVPYGTQPAPERRTEILQKALSSLRDYVDKVNSGEIEKPFALRGVTNPEMMKVAKRFGFKPVDEIKTESRTEYVVVALFDDLEMSLNALMARRIGGKSLQDKLDLRVSGQ